MWTWVYDICQLLFSQSFFKDSFGPPSFDSVKTEYHVLKNMPFPIIEENDFKEIIKYAFI